MKIAIFLIATVEIYAQTKDQGLEKARPVPRKSASDVYMDQQFKIIKDHAQILSKEGRMPVDFGNAERYLAEYGWRAGSVSSPGNRPPLWLLQEGDRQGVGSYGAYSFSETAYQQAKKQWWIHGVIEKGKDLLYPLNRNAKFNPDIIGHKVEYLFGETLNATVVEVQGMSYEWWGGGSDGHISHGPEAWYGPLKLSKPYPGDGKEPRFVYQYDIAILSPDYVDMCGCTIKTTTRTPEERAKDKPCVQGGTLNPGETCVMSIP